MVHKPKHKVHSFRGLLGDGGQDEINLERQNVNMAYRIVKLDIFAEHPGTQEYENVVKVFREEQSSITDDVDFTDADLLGVAYLEGHSDPYQTDSIHMVFDNTLFSRNIYVTHKNADSGAEACNYYIEIEEVPVTAATLMQLKLAVARKLSLTQDPES